MSYGTAPSFRTRSIRSCLQGFTIEIPKHERRRTPRYRAPKDLLVGWQGAGKRNVSNAEELGVGGVFLLVAHPLSAGTHVEMLFDVPGGEVRARAIVRSLRFRGPHFLVSGATGRGTKELAEAVMKFLEEQDREARAREASAAETGDAQPAST